MTHPGGRPRKFTSVAEIEAAIEAYFVECDKRTVDVPTRNGVVSVRKHMPYTMTGLAEAIGISRRRLIDYTGREDEYGEEFRPAIMRARELVERDSEERLQDGAGSDRGIMFSLKNNFGWKDVQQIEHGGGVGIEISERGRALIDRLARSSGSENAPSAPKEEP